MLRGMVLREFDVVKPVYTSLLVFANTGWMTATDPFEIFLSIEPITKHARHRHNIESLRMSWVKQKSVVIKPSKTDAVWTRPSKEERIC